MPDRPAPRAALAEALARHPRWAMATRAAVSATIAWYIARLLPDPVGQYPYYAPMVRPGRQAEPRGRR